MVDYHKFSNKNYSSAKTSFDMRRTPNYIRTYFKSDSVCKQCLYLGVGTNGEMKHVNRNFRLKK